MGRYDQEKIKETLNYVAKHFIFAKENSKDKNFNIDGTCFGVTLTAVLAKLNGQFNLLSKGLKEINRLSPEALTEKLTNAEKIRSSLASYHEALFNFLSESHQFDPTQLKNFNDKITDNKHLDDETKLMLALTKSIFRIIVSQDPDDYPKYFPKEHPPRYQHDEVILANFLPDGFQPGEVHKHSFSGIYSKQELTELIECLIKHAAPELIQSIAVSDSHHNIFLSLEKNKMISLDVDNQPTQYHKGNVTTLVDEIIRAYTDNILNPINSLNFTIYVKEKNLEALNELFAKLENDDDWKKLHDSRKATLIDTNGIHWLYHAAIIGDRETTKALLDAGANPNLRSAESHQTPLYQAARANKVGIIETLIAAGADVNLPSHSKQTPLLIACICGHLEAVEALIKAGANLEVKDSDLDRPLHVASKQGNIEIVKLLLEHGARCSVTNHDGKKPLNLAKDKKHPDVVALINAHTAKRTGLSVFSPATSEPVTTQENLPKNVTLPHLKKLLVKKYHVPRFHSFTD